MANIIILWRVGYVNKSNMPHMPIRHRCISIPELNTPTLCVRAGNGKSLDELWIWQENQWRKQWNFVKNSFFAIKSSIWSRRISTTMMIIDFYYVIVVVPRTHIHTTSFLQVYLLRSIRSIHMLSMTCRKFHAECSICSVVGCLIWNRTITFLCACAVARRMCVA